MILAANSTSFLSPTQDDLRIVHDHFGKAIHESDSVSSISGDELDDVCPKRNIIRFQFMLSFIQFFLTLLR